MKKREWDMRVEEHNHIIKFTGRTDDAQLPFFLSDYLKKVFTHELFEKQFSPEKREITFDDFSENKYSFFGLFP